MTGFYLFIFSLTFITISKEISCSPFLDTDDGSMRQRSHLFPSDTDNARHRRNEEERAGEGQSGGSGVQELLTTVVKDGVEASSIVESPTMLVGGFSLMMQPMPSGSAFASQLMQMAPHYLSLLPKLPTGGQM